MKPELGNRGSEIGWHQIAIHTLTAGAVRFRYGGRKHAQGIRGFRATRRFCRLHPGPMAAPVACLRSPSSESREKTHG